MLRLKRLTGNRRKSFIGWAKDNRHKLARETQQSEGYRVSVMHSRYNNLLKIKNKFNVLTLNERRCFIYPADSVYFCPMNSETGKWMVLLGVAFMIAGVLIYFFHDKLHWIGHLPGDIRIEKENFSFYFPITTMIIFSVLATVVMQLVRRFLG